MGLATLPSQRVLPTNVSRMNMILRTKHGNDPPCNTCLLYFWIGQP